MRRRTTCTVPGHGTRCIAVWERGPDDYCRTTEERLALRLEEIANEGEIECPSQASAA
jgi:hypothetical protein